MTPKAVVVAFADRCRIVELDARSIGGTAHVWFFDEKIAACGTSGYTHPAHRAVKVCERCDEIVRGREE